jgi:L-lactate permease
MLTRMLTYRFKILRKNQSEPSTNWRQKKSARKWAPKKVNESRRQQNILNIFTSWQSFYLLTVVLLIDSRSTYWQSFYLLTVVLLLGSRSTSRQSFYFSTFVLLLKCYCMTFFDIRILLFFWFQSINRPRVQRRCYTSSINKKARSVKRWKSKRVWRK